VAATAPAAGFTISGSPITDSGTLTFALADDLAGLENLSGTGLAVRTGTNTWTNRTIVGGTGISVTSGNGVSANPSIALSHLGIQNLSNPGADRIMFWDQSGSTAEWLTVDTNTLTISGTTLSANYGSGTAGQVAYWSGSNTLTSEAAFAYNASTNVLSVDGIELGVSATTGTTRRIIPIGTEPSIDLELYPKVSGNVVLGTDDSGNVQIGRSTAGGNRTLKIGSASTNAGFIVESKGVSPTLQLQTLDDPSVQLQLGVSLSPDSAYISSAAQLNFVGSGITIDTLTGFLILANIPTSSAGLPSGAVWANSNVLTIVP
jgi:hypothetical protein